MKNKLISKCQHGKKIRDLNSQLLVQQAGPRGVIDTYDDGVIQLNLPTIEVRPEGVELNDQDKYKQSYENLIYTLKSKGYNNLADDIQQVGQTQGIGNALYHYQDIINRRAELLKSKGAHWDENEAKRMGVAAMSAPYAPLAAIGVGKFAGNIIGNIATNPTGFAADVAIGTGMSKVANTASKIRTGKDIYERAQERYPNDPIKAFLSGMLRDPGTYVGLNTALRGKNAYKLSKNLIEAGGIKNYKIAKVISNNLDNTIPTLSEIPYSKQLYMDYPSSNIHKGISKEYYNSAIKPFSNKSTLSRSEQLGIPKHIRKMDSPKINDLIEPYKYYQEKFQTKKGLFSNFKEWYSNNNILQDNNKISPVYNPFGHDLPDNMLQFVKDIPEPVIKYSDNHINAYRNYLTAAKYNHETLSDLDIQKILNASEKAVVEKQTGLFKGKPVYHSSDEIFDEFNWRKTGENTLNMGGQGPANYFSSSGSIYGDNIQPYFINNVKKVVPGFVKNLYFQYKPTPGNLSSVTRKNSKFITPGHRLYDDYQLRKNEIQRAINATKESNTIYYGKDAPLQYFNGKSLEFALPRNTGIKSLFPHPDTFIKNSDGTISLIRDWDNPKLNFKQGGKLNE